MLQNKLDCKDEEMIKLMKKLTELDVIEQARTNRSERLERELRGSIHLLLEATSATAESESTASTLNDTIKEIQHENQSLHQQMETFSEKTKKNRDHILESLTRSQREVQNMSIKAASDDEEIQCLKMDKDSSEKEITQMRNRISNIEKRLSDANASNALTSNDARTDELCGHSSFPKIPQSERKAFKSIGNMGSNTYKTPPLRTVTPKIVSNISSGKDGNKISKTSFGSALIK